LAAIAIIDTGIDATHPDLQGKVIAGKSFVPYTTSWDDDFGHGSFCAGIIGATANNALGIAGQNWSAKLLIVKGLDYSGWSW
jgi:subtilisin family serine protease